LKPVLTLGWCAAATLSAITVAAQDLEEVIVTGSRGQPRSVFDTPAPVDVLRGDALRQQSPTDLNTLLRNNIPSFNLTSQPINDASTVVRPANLRGLASDHTLVLVNSKRRHRASVITWLGNGVSDGAQGPDISALPAIALKRVEVLRDGAAAQYGSDAIAGIVNFILDDSDSGGSVEARFAEYTADGEQQYGVAGNLGFALGEDGFINLSAEFGQADATSRSVQRDDAAALISAGNTAVANPAQVWGTPKVEDDLKTVFNAGWSVNDRVRLYSFGNYASKKVTGGFFFRNPDTRSGVFANNGYRLVADVTADNSGSCPRDLRPDDAGGLDAVIANPHCFVFNEWFPGGFTPRFGGEVEDHSIVVGTRGTFSSGWQWDLSASWGQHRTEFFLHDSVNASLGPDTPTRFDVGANKQQERMVSLDFGRGLLLADTSLYLSGGLEWREETFSTALGEPASYAVGRYADQGFSAASNGFPGYGPLAAGEHSRANTAVWADASIDATTHWRIDLAVRYEDFDDFGGTLNGKLGTLYTVNDQLLLRATASTGFRAPTPGQANVFNVSTVFNSVSGELENNGTIAPTSPVAALRGGTQLEPEESVNLSAGLVFNAGRFSLTLDAFMVTIDDRIGLTRNYQLTAAERALLVAAGVAGADSINTFRFFANGIETETRGVDLVASWDLDSALGQSRLQAAFNHTRTEVSDYVEGIIDDERIRRLEQGLPENRLVLSLDQQYGQLNGVIRLNYFDDWYDSEDGQEYNGYWTVSADVSVALDAGWTLQAGVDNMFDEVGDESSVSGILGNRYGPATPAGINGRQLFGRVTYSF